MGTGQAACQILQPPLLMPFKDNVLVAGDSSWMQETGINGALMPGWSAANAVTEAILKNEINKNGICELSCLV